MGFKRIYGLLWALVALILVLVFVQTKDVEPPPAEEEKEPEEIVSVSDKKRRFLDEMVPVVDKVHAELMQRYRNVKTWLDEDRKHNAIEELKREYKAETDAELLRALKPHPQSVALAQAAMESAWGTSRFFSEANNIFGVWSFNANEPRIAAGEQRGDKTIWVRKYDSLEDSVRDYYRLLGRSSAFKEFRELRMHSTDPHALVEKLHRYSEKKHAYGEELSAVIRYNKFTRFDDDQS
ncbi:MAG: glucosaminidase domain-containing protein [Geobacteraceae bacterium]|nr:glucosaminidase domain-containing protein [Geobacteraceae bacterium]